ncbi:MAG: carbon-nitrogen hydrolase family protein [Desulfobulbus oligotrophicus]|jgi:predicted amidohydrolase|nr:carbon-nitrogen hydrolase family protein [Desulfobulbus oligotrophicus]
MSVLKIALAHAAVVHKQPQKNRRELLALVQEAGEQGVQLVVAPELMISGYSFAGHHDMEPYAETAEGPTVTAVAALCRQYGMYVCVGMAELEPLTGILYNSAFVLDPTGSIVCRYRKINAECRWACPGDPCQDNTFDTPWGRMGVLICSDSYHSLMARVTALRGAVLLLIPSTWPPIGVNPVEIWQARALENRLFVAACNRTGCDLIMDCRQAPSAFIDPQGTVVLQKQAATSQLLIVDLHLQDSGRIQPAHQSVPLPAGDLSRLRSCYLNLSGITNLTQFLQLPPPGCLLLCCHALLSPDGAPALTVAETTDAKTDTLHVLPAHAYSRNFLDEVRSRCAATGHSALFINTSQTVPVVHWLNGAADPCLWNWDTLTGGQEGQPVDCTCGPARVRLLPMQTLRQPELVLASAKEGVDVVIVLSPHFNEIIRLLAGVRTIEQVAVAVCSPEGAGIWMIPTDHQRWGETLAGPGGSCCCFLDTGKTRVKRFQERIDYSVLLQGRASTSQSR